VRGALGARRTRPRDGQNTQHLQRPHTHSSLTTQQIFGATYKVPEEIWLKVHFTGLGKQPAAGREFLKRFLRRTENRDPEVNEKVAPPRSRQIGKWACSVRVPMNTSRPSLQPRW